MQLARSLFVRFAWLYCAAMIAPAQVRPSHAEVLGSMDQQAARFGTISQQIWDLAEVGYQEVRSADILKDELRKNGFVLEERVGGIPTAFVASWGHGKPVIGILGEYDALPGLSQKASPVREEVAPGRAGHGCGHNLLGTGSAFAAIAVKQFLEHHKLPGTIVFYGSPAEEGGGGKVFMARAGVFQRCDAILSWHPDASNRVVNGISLANINAKFQFYGKPSHAAMSPEQGRSALDGVLLMSNCVELMREHVPQDTRMHYVITNGGGAPNVVPGFAELFLYARQANMTVLDDVWSRIGNCAQAGSLGTGTRMEQHINASVYSLLPNAPLATLLDRNLHEIGGYRLTAEERAFAEQLRTSFNGTEAVDGAEKILPMTAELISGSTDVGDVSWIVPTAQVYTATAIPGTPGHSWQNVACAGTGIGRKGMLVAAKTMALTAVDLMETPTQLEAVRADFLRARAGKEYRSRIPESIPPPLTYRSTASGAFAPR